MEQSIKQRIADIRRGNVPTGYKVSRSGIIPDGWTCCQPKEIFSGKSIKNNDPALPVLSVTQESGVMLRDELDKDISYKEESISNYKRVDVGDFVISLRSFQGGIEYSSCRGVVSPAYTVFSLSEQACCDYYKYYFKTDFFIKRLNSAVYGIREGKQVGFQDFGNLHIHYPPLAEQRRIAEILGCCDRGIALKKELIAEKRRQKKALMQKLLYPDSGFRLPGFTGEWRCQKLGAFCDTFSGGTPERSHPEYYCGEIPWIKSGELNSRFINTSEEYISISALENSSAKMVEANTLLIAMYGATAGAIAITNIKAAINQAILAIIPDESVNKTFLMYSLKNQIDLAILKFTQGGQPNFNAAIIKALSIHTPNVKEQQAIADILSAADKEIDLLEQELAQQQQKKKSLMQLLLTGIARV